MKGKRRTTRKWTERKRGNKEMKIKLDKERDNGGQEERI